MTRAYRDHSALSLIKDKNASANILIFMAAIRFFERQTGAAQFTLLIGRYAE
jgi:hypothetical protein